MRRLVDVDESIKYFAEDLEGYDNREYILQMLDTKGRIERVEAIPIDYMKQWAKDRTRENWFADHPSVIARLIVDWEKENQSLE